MKIIEKDFYKILREETNEFSSILTYLKNEEESLQNSNLAIDLLQVKGVTAEEALKFLPIAESYRENKRSFVLVTQDLHIDELPEELAVVPSLVEAEDLIQMEEIERELGF